MRLWPIFLLALPEYHYHNLPVNADIIIRYPIGDSILAQMDRMILFKKVTCFRLLNFSHVMRTNQSKFSKFGRWKFIDHRFFSFFTDFTDTSFFLEFHLKRHHLMTKLFTSLHTKVHKSEAYLKSVQKGMSHSIAHQKAVDFMVQRTWTSCPSHRSFFVSTL